MFRRWIVKQTGNEGQYQNAIGSSICCVIYVYAMFHSPREEKRPDSILSITFSAIYLKRDQYGGENTKHSQTELILRKKPMQSYR